MADKELMDRVDELLDSNTNGISTVSELGRQLYRLDPRKNVESWRKELRRWRTQNAKEADIALIALAFGIPRKRLPPVKARPTLADVDRRLAAIEAMVGRVEAGNTVGNLLEELATKLGDALSRLAELEAVNGFGGASGRRTP